MSDEEDLEFNADIFDNRDIMIKELKCNHCLSEIEVECYIVPGHTDFESVKCPVCKNPIRGEIRADLGYTVLKKKPFACDGFEAKEEGEEKVTADRPMLCQWCKSQDEETVCSHPDDPKKFRKEEEKKKKLEEKKNEKSTSSI